MTLMKTNILIVVTLLSALLNAQNLSLQESIDKTLHNHPDIKSFELQIAF